MKYKLPIFTATQNRTKAAATAGSRSNNNNNNNTTTTTRTVLYLRVRAKLRHPGQALHSLVPEQDAHLSRPLRPRLAQHSACDGLAEQLEKVVGGHLHVFGLGRFRAGLGWVRVGGTTTSTGKGRRRPKKKRNVLYQPGTRG